MNNIAEVYSLLFRRFGAQGWWPITVKGSRPTYNKKTELNDKRRFEIIAGAILAQNTSWKNAEKAIIELNRRKLIDIEKIIKIKKEELAKLIRSSGYYNQKAERLKTAAKFFKDRMAELRELETGELRARLLEVKGIGKETADSIILYAFEKPIFVIDAYTKRIFERLGYRAKEYDEWQKLFMDNLPKDTALFKEYHALIVELGKRNCRKKQECAGCAIAELCSRG